MQLSRAKLGALSEKLRNEEGFPGIMLGAAKVSPAKLRARATKDDDAQPAARGPPDADAAHAPPSVAAVGKPLPVPRLDVTSDSVSGSLVQWRAPSRLYVWGRGVEGQLGCGTLNAQAALSRVVCPMRIDLGGEGGASPAPPAGGEEDGFSAVTPIRVACSRRVTAVIDNKRRLWVLGEGWFGRPAKERAHVPTLVSGLEKHAVVECAMGVGFTMACTLEGAVLVWGENEGLAKLAVTADKGFRRDVDFLRPPPAQGRGRAELTGGGTAGTAGGHPLGLEPGTPFCVTTPRVVTGLAREMIIAVAAGEAHLVALGSSGRVYTWGAGSSGATGQGSTENVWKPTPLTLRPVPRVAPVPSFRRANEDAAAPHITAFSALTARERRRSIAQVDGAKAAGTLGLGAVAKLGAGGGGAKEEGAGGSGGGAFTQADEARYACAIAAGSHHTAVLARDGTVHVCGFAESGRLGLGMDRSEPVPLPTPLTGHGLPSFTSLACGGAHTLMVSADGRVYATGDNAFGQCGVNTRTQRAGKGGVFERLAGGGEVVHAERRVLSPRQIFTPVFGDVITVKVIAGTRHSGAIDLHGVAWAWGLNEEGSCGSGDEVTSPEPSRVARLREVRVLQAASGDAHSAAIVARARHVAPGQSISALDDDDASGAAMTLEPPLPLNLRRERRQQLNIRRKAIAFCFARKRRLAKLARKRLLRRMLSQHIAQHSDSAAARGDAHSSSLLAADLSIEMAKGQPGEDRQPWELDLDNAEYGRHSAATIIQSLFRRWLGLIQRYRRTHSEVLTAMGVTNERPMGLAGLGAARVLQQAASSGSSGMEVEALASTLGSRQTQGSAALTKHLAGKAARRGSGSAAPAVPTLVIDARSKAANAATLARMGFSAASTQTS